MNPVEERPGFLVRRPWLLVVLAFTLLITAWTALITVAVKHAPQQIPVTNNQ